MNKEYEKIRLGFITDRMIKGHGVDLVVDRIADGLAKKGYTCKVYCNHYDETFTGRKSYDIVKLPFITPNMNPWIYERETRRLAPYFNDKKTDLFIIQSFPFYSLIPKLESPVLAVDHGIVDVQGMPFRRQLRFKYMKFSQNVSYFRKAKQLVTVSKYLLETLPKQISEDADFIYNGCDHYYKKVDPADVKSFRNDNGIADDDVLMLFVGRLNLTNQPYKGLEELVGIYQELSRKHSNLQCMAIGYGSINDRILLENQGLKVMRNVPEQMMPMVYSACDIYTTCSIWEGFDLPVAEAQTFSKPVVCYDIGAHPEVCIDGETGFIVDDRQGFVERLDTLIADKDLRLKMGKTAKHFSKKLSWENSIDNYNQKIKTVLDIDDEDLEGSKKISEIKEKSEDWVTALIINYNSSTFSLKSCIDSLKAQSYKNLEILIFDNASRNDVLKIIEKQYPEIKIIYSDKNLGLAGGINEAIKHINSRFVLISNFDVYYDSNAVEFLVETLNGLDTEYLGLAPKIKLSYRKDYIESVGTFLDGNLNAGFNGIGQIDMDQYDLKEDIFGLSFVSAFVKRKAFRTAHVGPLDPTFFLFYEDFDFCYRANLLGYKFKSCSDARCFHRYAYSFREEATSYQQKYYYQKLNQLKTIYKNVHKSSLNKILDSEISNLKANFNDINLKKVSKSILRDFRRSLSYLKRARKKLQFTRIVPDSEVFKHCWGEANYFDPAKNEPVYSISNLLHTYRRLHAITGADRYEQIESYLENIQNTKFNIQSKITKQILHGKLQYEPISVHDFINRID